MENSFFEDHFRFSCKIGPISMYIIPLTHHVFSSFLFYQELRTFKNYRAFRFKVPDKKLISSRRITIFQGRMSISHQNLLLQFFSNMECDCAADNFRSSPILDNFRRLHPTWIRCAALFAFPSCPILYAKIDAQISNFSSHTSQPPANDIYVKCTFWWHVLFSTIVPWLYSKDDFRIAMVHSLAEKIRSDGCWSNMFPCVSGRVVVDYDEFG